MLLGPKKTVCVTLPLGVYEILKKRAEEECRTVPSCIRMILKKHLEEDG